MTPFRHALPLLVVTFVNRMASIALAVLPALLVAREAGPVAAAVSMGIARGAMIVGALGSGVVADRRGLRPTLVASLVVAGAGVLAMGLDGPLWLLVAGAGVAQVGVGAFPVVSRLVLFGLVPIEAQREAIAWQRATSNLGLVVSFGLGALLGTWVGFLLLLDGLCSLAAAGLALRLPATRRAEAPPTDGGGGGWLVFAWATAIQCGWSLGYEAYLTATAAQLRAALGPDGISWYSAVMVLNVVGCAGLGVLAARWIDDPRWSVPLGSLLLALGGALGVAWPGWQAGAALGMAIVTAGELLFTATSQFVWISLVPRSGRPSTVFSTASTVVALARALGAALAFPLIVDARAPAWGLLLLAGPGVLVGAAAVPVWRAFARR